MQANAAHDLMMPLHRSACIEKNVSLRFAWIRPTNLNRAWRGTPRTHTHTHTSTDSRQPKIQQTFLLQMVEMLLACNRLLILPKSLLQTSLAPLQAFVSSTSLYLAQIGNVVSVGTDLFHFNMTLAKTHGKSWAWSRFYPTFVRHADFLVVLPSRQ